MIQKNWAMSDFLVSHMYEYPLLLKLAYLIFTLYALASSNTSAVQDACNNTLIVIVIIQILSLFIAESFAILIHETVLFIFFVIMLGLSGSYTGQAMLNVSCNQALQSTNGTNLNLLAISSWIYCAACFISLTYFIKFKVIVWYTR